MNSQAAKHGSTGHKVRASFFASAADFCGVRGKVCPAWPQLQSTSGKVGTGNVARAADRLERTQGADVAPNVSATGRKAWQVPSFALLASWFVTLKCQRCGAVKIQPVKGWLGVRALFPFCGQAFAGNLLLNGVQCAVLL